MPATKTKRVLRRRPKRRRCAICSARGAETFNFLRRRFVFDVDQARKIVGDGRPEWRMYAVDIRYAVETSRIHWDHVPHVRVRFPGIVARVRIRQPDGTLVEGDLLIDGHHRAAKCLRLRRPFTAYRLSVDETDSILIKRADVPKHRKR